MPTMTKACPVCGLELEDTCYHPDHSPEDVQAVEMTIDQAGSLRGAYVETEMLDIRQQLALSVLGPYASLDGDNLPPLDDLIYRAGEHRRQLEAAHSWLDLQGVKKGELTVRGRLEAWSERVR